MPTPRWLAPLFDYEGQLHNKVVSQIQAMGNHAASKNESRHEEWNRVERLHQLYVDPAGENDDKGGKQSAFYANNIRVPVARAIFDANVTQWWLPWAVRDPISPFRGRGPEDGVSAMLMSVHTDWQIRQRKLLMKLHALMQSCAKYGLGVCEVEWVEDDRKRWIRRGAEERVVRNHYTGNDLRVIDPYRWLSDPGLTTTEFQDGEFCGYSFEISHIELVRRMARKANGADPEDEEAPGWINREHMEKYNKTNAWKQYPFLFGSAKNASMRNQILGVPEQDDELEAWGLSTLGPSSQKRPLTHVLTVWDQQIIPDELRQMAKECGCDSLPDELGSMDPEIWRFMLLDGTMIVDVEPTSCTQFGFQLMEPAPDMLGRFTKGKLELLADMSDYLDFLFNSRIAEVETGIFPDEIYNPQMIEQRDIESQGPGRLIRLKPDAWTLGVPIETHYTRLSPRASLTQEHLRDFPTFVGFMQDLTGVSEQTMGSTSRGRRAATDVNVAAQQGAARFDTELKLLNDQCIFPIFAQFAENTQLFETVERWYAITGNLEEMLRRSKQRGAPPLMDAERFDEQGGRVLIAPADLQGEFDLDIMDGNPQTVDMQAAQSIIQMMQVAGSIPGFWQEYSPEYFVRQAFMKMGLRNELFQADMRRMEGAQSEIADAAALEQQAAALESQAQAGNLQPIPGV